jgi:cobalamin biosynthesis Mg chelatase CobN
MARQQRLATADEVRTWARANGYDVGERGRFSTDVVNGFNKAHKRNNLAYPGGSVDGGSTPAPSRSTPTPARSTASTSHSTPARSARRAPTTATHSGGGNDSVGMAVADAIAALTAQANAGGDTPILITVQTLAHV